MAKNSSAPDDFTEPDDITEYGLDADPYEDSIDAYYEYEDDPNYDPTEHMTKEELDELAREAEVTQQEYEAALVQEAIRGISKDAARSYLSRYGDAVDARIEACLQEAKQLAAANHPGPALALAATALEITIRFLLLRPLVQGAFLSDRWAALLATRIATGRTAEDREMLPVILREWGINVTKVKSSSGIQVWPFIVARLWGLRDKFVHRFDPVAPEIALQAIECAQAFRTEVVGAVAKRLRFTLNATQRWSAITRANGTIEKFETADPFDESLKPKKT